MKTSIYIMLFTLLFSISSLNLYGQTRVKVTGEVIDALGAPISGASISVQNSKQATKTDEQGKFEIRVEKGNILLVSAIGYHHYAKQINDTENLKISLDPDEKEIEEVVVIGYGTQKKSSVTGSVSKLVNTNLDEIPSSRLDNALIGQIAGVTIQNVTSEVGADPVVRVRGFNSISTNTSPLVVVDGYPVPDGLSFINPQDVESIEVLKDAASAAIYGSRAANGVILVTTKSGIPDRPQYSVKAYTGVRNTLELHPIMTMTEYVNLLYEEAALRENDPSVADNRKNLINNNERAQYVIENQIVGQATDWQQMGLQNATISNIQLGLSGGKKEVKYYLTGNAQTDNGVMRYSKNDKMSVRSKINATLSPKVKLNFNINPSYSKTRRPGVNYTDYYRWYSYVPAYHTEYSAAFVNQNPQWSSIQAGDYAQARHFNGLHYSGYMPDGTFWTSSGTIDPWSTTNNTPLSIANRTDNTRQNYRILGSMDLDYEIVKNLIFKTSVGGYYTLTQDQTFVQSNAKQDGALNEATIYTRHYKDVLWENTLNYTKKIHRHNFTGLLGFTTQQTWIDDANMVGRDFPTEDFKTLNQAGQIDQEQTYTLKDQIGLISYLGRITYDFDSKYMLAASYRIDGSSYFAKGNKYGTFPSISAGWMVSEEDFMKDISWLNSFKIRSSYGATGNNKINSFAFQDLMYPANYAFGTGTGEVTLGLSPNSELLANPNITWERTFESNTGIDASFLRNRINLTVEYYSSKTDRLLYEQATMAYSGSDRYINNAGSVQNKGMEVELTTKNIHNAKVEWTTSLNFSRNRNTLINLGGEAFQHSYGEREEVYIAKVGDPSIQFFGYKTDGVWLSQAQIDEAVDNGLTTNLSNYLVAGGLKIVDVDGNNHIDQNDRTIIGNPFPDFTWGITNTVKYKNFDLSILFQGVKGGQLINGDLNYNESKRFNRKLTENRWLSEMYPGDGKTPYFTNGINMMLTDYVVENASYASLRSAILGYTFNQKKLNRLGIKALRIYTSGENLIYLMGKGYRGINPEARTISGEYDNPLISGYQRGGFPLMRTYTFGLDFNF